MPLVCFYVWTFILAFITPINSREYLLVSKMTPKALSKLRRIKRFLSFIRRLTARNEDPKCEVSLPLERPSHLVLTTHDSRDEMASDFLKPRPQAAARSRQVLEAQKEQQNVTERAQRRGLDVPSYEFLELIGKGSYGPRNSADLCGKDHRS